MCLNCINLWCFGALNNLISSFPHVFMLFFSLVLSQQTFWLFIWDMIKGILLSVVLAPPIVAAIIVIVQVHHIFILCHPLF